MICLLVFLLNTPASAQLQKGSWMLNGAFFQENFSSSRAVNQFSLTIAPEVSYMVTDRLMLGGQLEIRMGGNQQLRIAPVSQKLLIRHYFKNLNNFYLFYGGKIEFTKTTVTQRNGGNNIFKEQSANIQSGLQVFLQENLAFEFLLNYQMIIRNADNTSNSVGNGLYSSGGLRFSGGLQFFLHSKNIRDNPAPDYRFRKGDWLLGGQVLIGNPDNLQPVAYRFFGSGWAVGARLELQYTNARNIFASLGIHPLIRKYFFKDKKRKLFLEAGTGINGSYLFRIQARRPSKWLTLFRTLRGEATVGWSTFINKNVNLDFFVTRNWNKRIFSNGRDIIRLQEFSFGMAFQGALRSKKIR